LNVECSDAKTMRGELAITNRGLDILLFALLPTKQVAPVFVCPQCRD
jgi:hypothetical protein